MGVKDAGMVVVMTKYSSLPLRSLFILIMVMLKLVLKLVMWMGGNNSFVCSEHPSAPDQPADWASRASQSSSTNSKGSWTRSKVNVCHE